MGGSAFCGFGHFEVFRALIVGSDKRGNEVQLKNVRPISKTVILAVDDNPTSLRLLEIMLQNEAYEVISVSSAIAALEVLESEPNRIDVILLDRMMPEMDGIEFCNRIKQDARFRAIPVIMQTAAGRPQEIKEGIEAGVFYYLVKPLVAETLISIVESARKKNRKYRYHKGLLLQRKESMSMVNSMNCSFRTIEEGETLAAFLAQFFPTPDLAITGISEIFLNAVEHGNLEIDYEEKGHLIQNKRWKDEVELRLQDPQFEKRKVSVGFERKEEGYVLQVADEGKGFDWKKFLQVDVLRATHNHGRGIAMANMISFDKLLYNDRGNEVTAIVLD